MAEKGEVDIKPYLTRLVYTIDQDNFCLVEAPFVRLTPCWWKKSKKEYCCDGTRFKHVNFAECKGSKTCYYGKIIQTDVLIKWCAFVKKCNFCGRVFYGNKKSKSCPDEVCQTKYAISQPYTPLNSCHNCGQPAIYKTTLSCDVDLHLDDRHIVGGIYPYCSLHCLVEIKQKCRQQLEDGIAWAKKEYPNRKFFY
jgi:hypothetical protein